MDNFSDFNLDEEDNGDVLKVEGVDDSDVLERQKLSDLHKL